MTHSRRKMLNAVLWILGALMVADLSYVSYFFVLRADYYFPDRYEYAFQAAARAFVIGLPLIIAFLIVWFRRFNPKDEVTESSQSHQHETNDHAA